MNTVKTILIFVILDLNLFCKADNYTTRIYTDRDIYTSGSYSLFIAYLPVEDSLSQIYVSLNELDGELIKGVNLRVENSKASGCIYLPDSLRSGSYLVALKSSEFLPKPIFCKEIFVLNRFDEQLGSAELQRAELPFLPETENTSVLFSGLDSIYHQREDVNFTITMDSKSKEELEGDLSVVVSEYLPGWQSTYLPVNRTERNVLSASSKGAILKGKVINKYTSKPVRQATVFFSISDSIPYFDYSISDDEGRFRFTLNNFFGSYQILLQVVKENCNDSLKLIVEQPTNCDDIHVKTKPLVLDQSLLAFFSNFIDLASLKKVYQFQELQFDTVSYHPVYSFPFYGKVEYRIDTDLYFDLPDFKSISKELIPQLRFRENNNQISLRMLNRELSEFFLKSPFVLIDGVPLPDVSLLNKLGSKQIDWIDVVPSHRYFGDLDFDGVVAIYTKEKNASQIPSSDRFVRLNFETFQPGIGFVPEAMNVQNAPHFRQVLFWQPNIKASESIPLNFRTSDMKGHFQVLLIGRKKNGELFESRKNFRVTR